MLILLHQLQGLARRVMPLLVCLSFLFLGLAVTAFPVLAAIPPLFTLVAVYYWSVHRPDLLPLPLLFLLGLINDALLRLPFGLSSLCFIIVAQLIISQRAIFIDQAYGTLWLGFAALMALTQALSWGLLSLLTGQLLPVLPLLLQGLITLALFPALVWLLALLQRHIVH